MGCSLTDGFIQQMLASVSHDLVGHATTCNSHNTSVVVTSFVHSQWHMVINMTGYESTVLVPISKRKY